MMQYPSAHFPGWRMLCLNPLVVFRLQSLWLTMQAKLSSTNFDGLSNLV